MPCLLIRHTVQDYADLEGGLRRARVHAPGQRLPGWTALPQCHRLRMRSWSSWSGTTSSGHACSSTPTICRRRLTRAGVADRPDIWFLEDVRPSTRVMIEDV